MREHLAQHFVDLAGRGLAPHALAELRLYHVEYHLDVAGAATLL